jgi:hypothetical protein
MSKSDPFAPPDSFALAPFIALLPVIGKLSHLEQLSASLFARYEKVLMLRKEVMSDDNRDLMRRLVAEEEMLKVTLDWLSRNGNNTTPARGGE